MKRAFLLGCAAAVAGLGLTSASADAQSVFDRLSIHGYLTQGFASSTDQPLLGISTGVSADLRAAALQFRYGISDVDNVIVQLSHRTMGGSVITKDEGDVTLDWGFYQRKFGPVSARVGRVPFQRGIFNEVRDVGTILPFYRASYLYYTESFETIDGLTVAMDRDVGSWAVDTSAYFGGFDYRVASSARPTGPMLINVRAEKVLGGQLWISTPIRGLRVGGGGDTWELTGKGPFTGSEDARGQAARVNLDADFNRFDFRVELQRAVADRLDYKSGYAQLGINVTEKFAVNAQHELADVVLPIHHPATGDFLFEHPYDLMRDSALGVSYRLNPNAVLKLEGHRAKGYYFDRYVDIMGAGESTNYLIGSVSVSF